MVTKIESILEDRLNGCTKCTEVVNEKLIGHYRRPAYTSYIGVCGIKKNSLQEHWDNVYRNMCRNIEKEPKKIYRTLRSILHRFAKIKSDELKYKEIKEDYLSGKLKRKYIEQCEQDIINIQKTIDVLSKIPDRDFFIHTCKNEHVFAYGNPEEVLNTLNEVCSEQTGKTLNEMIKEAEKT